MQFSRDEVEARGRRHSKDLSLVLKMDEDQFRAFNKNIASLGGVGFSMSQREAVELLRKMIALNSQLMREVKESETG